MPKPTFLIIGAQKCGTDALYHALKQHPDIAMSPNKEPFFFLMDGRLPDYRLPGPRYTNRLVYDWEAYQQLFAGAEGKRAIGEASAIYLSSYFPEKTAARIRDRIPDAKLIALVRQPALAARAMLLGVLDGRPGAPRDIVALNAGAAIYVSGRAPSLEAGVRLAGELIASGAAKARLEHLVAFSRQAAT